MKLAASLLGFGLVLVGPALASFDSAAACPPQLEPGPVVTRARGIHRVALTRSGPLARDGGALFIVDAEGVTPDEVLTSVGVTVTAGGAPVPGELRRFDAATAGGERPSLQFFPVGGLLPATKTLHVELTFVAAPGIEPPVKSFDAEVDDVRLTDLALPELSISIGAASLQPDTASPLIRCILRVPTTSTSADDCGGTTTTSAVSETTFPARQTRLRYAELSGEGRYTYGVERYVTYQSRVIWAAGAPAGSDAWGYYGGGASYPVPASARGEVCYEVLASSTLLPGFPKTARFCQALPDVAPVTAAEDATYLEKAAEPCRELIAPPGVAVPSSAPANAAPAAESDSGGCSTHGAPVRSRGGAALLGLGLVVGALARRRAARQP